MSNLSAAHLHNEEAAYASIEARLWPHGATCPKCEGEMRNYERNGIVIDQCRECRGVFLDRGELERMIDAEGAFQQSAPGPAPQRDQRDQRHESSHGCGATPLAEMVAVEVEQR